jgi:hypothetical protein
MSHAQKDSMLRLLVGYMIQSKRQFTDETYLNELNYFIDYIESMLPKIKEEAHA